MTIVTTVEADVLGLWSRWSSRIMGALVCLAILGCCILYTRHLRHEITGLKTAQVTAVAQKSADTSADKAYTQSHTKTAAKKEKADVTIATAAAAHPEEAEADFPDDLADALRSPDDQPTQRVQDKRDHPAGRQVPAKLPSDLPAIEAVR